MFTLHCGQYTTRFTDTSKITGTGIECLRSTVDSTQQDFHTPSKITGTGIECLRSTVDNTQQDLHTQVK